MVLVSVSMTLVAMCLLAADVTDCHTRTSCDVLNDHAVDMTPANTFDGFNLVSSVTANATTRSTATTIPSAIYDGPTILDMTPAGTFDGFNLAPYVNDTSWGSWFFDVVSETPSSKESVVFYFRVGGPKTYFVPYGGSPISVLIDATFADGTNFSTAAAASSGISAAMVASGTGSSATWADTGFKWTGAPDASMFTIEVDSPQTGVKGTVVMNSLAPGHLPCGVPTSPADSTDSANSAELFVDVGFFNAIPAASATVSLDLNGRKLEFVGLGFHDNAWGGVIPMTAFKRWYWGHAQVGPYTMVWWNGQSALTSRQPNHHFTTGYVARDGEVLFSSCDDKLMRARPWGRNSEYPPTPATGMPDGVTIEFDVGDHVYFVNVTSALVLQEHGNAFSRHIGEAQGGLRGGETFSGRSMWDTVNL